MHKVRAAVAVAVAAAILAGAVPLQRVVHALPPTATTQVPPIIGNGFDGVLRDVPTKYYAAIDWFEAQAVSSVLETHSLPEADRAAVMAWGRDAVRTQLYLDLLAIIAKAPESRTTNEALVYEYFQELYKDQLIAGAQAAVDEYLAWSGLTLETIDQDPIPVTLDGRGYCRFRPPDNVNQGIAPFGLVYNASQLPQCFSAQASLSCVTLPTGCPAPWPSEEQFQLWGRYRSQQEIYDDPVYRNLAFETATGIGLASSMVATGVGTATARAFLAGPIEGTKLFTKVFPYAGKAVFQSGPNVTQAAIQSANAATKAAGAAVRAASIAFVVGTVISAVLTIALETWTIVERRQINRNLLRFLDEARNSSPDLKALVEKEDGASALLSTFLSTTAIDVDLDCRLSDADFPTSRFPCANAPALPAPTATDPVFYVTRPSAQGAVGRFSNSIYLINPVSSSDTVNLNVDVRLSGNGWFVGTKYDGSRSENRVVPGGTPGASNQALRLYYADWDRGGKVATRVMVDGRPMFAIASLQEDEIGACTPGAQALSTGVCLTDTIQFLQPDGTKASARIVASDATGPDVDVVVPDRVVAGQPVTLSATATATFGAGPFTYTWSVPGQAAVTGPSVATTFRLAGPNTVTLTVGDNLGGSTTRRIEVLVSQSTDVQVLTLPASSATIDSRVQVWARVTPRVSQGVQCEWNQQTGAIPCNAPSGVVQFFLDGTPIGRPVSLDQNYTEPCFAAGTCSFVFGDNRTYAPAIELPVNFPVGSELAITATYYGDTRFVGATSAPTTLTVAKAQPVVEMTSGPLYASPQSPGPITSAVRSSSATGPVPTGLVQFMVVAGTVEVPIGDPVPIDANGTATLTGGNLSFVPNLKAVYQGDGNFAARESAVAPVQFPPTNTPPVARADVVVIDEDAAATALDVLGNDSDVDGDDLVISAFTASRHGSLDCSSTSCTYRPDPNFNGSDSFVYTVSDGELTSSAGVQITVTPVDDPPATNRPPDDGSHHRERTDHDRRARWCDRPRRRCHRRGVVHPAVARHGHLHAGRSLPVHTEPRLLGPGFVRRDRRAVRCRCSARIRDRIRCRRNGRSGH